jgi:2-hydroxy-6-oxonona-2,4-dienedioate hydrolase
VAQRVKFDERWIDIGGIRTRYIIEGTGEPVLFLHGGQFGDSSTAECAEVWNLTIPQMSDRFTCIAVDRTRPGLHR